MTARHESEVYSAFADIYDDVMRDVDYESWAEHVIRLSQRLSGDVHRILDVACGTGTLAIELARRGYRVTGVDRSKAMLSIAETKTRNEEMTIPYQQCSMEDFAAFRGGEAFDLVTCLYDSLNYVLEEDAVSRFFYAVNRQLREGGGLIFDVTTEYNLLHNFSGYTFAENFDTTSYIWENEYDIVNKICTSKVTIFYQAKSAYHKQVENHRQRVYTSDALKRMLDDAGFCILGMFHNMTEEPPQTRCERVHYVCEKVRAVSFSEG